MITGWWYVNRRWVMWSRVSNEVGKDNRVGSGLLWRRDVSVTSGIWRKVINHVSGDPRGGSNVLRGLSNKCLMRGTFPAIFIFGYFHCFFVKILRKYLPALWEARKKNREKNLLFFGFFQKPEPQVFVFLPLFGGGSKRGFLDSPKWHISPEIGYFHHFGWWKMAKSTIPTILLETTSESENFRIPLGEPTKILHSSGVTNS